MQAFSLPARRWLAALWLVVGLALPARAQQTIVNVPSVEQTKAGKLFFLHETQVRDWGGNSFWLTTNFLTYGVTDRFELALTTYNLGTPREANQAVALGWKTAQPLWAASLPQWEIKLGAGQMLPVNISSRNQGLGGVGVWSYAQASFRLPGVGTRVMGGISNAPRQLFGQQTTHFIGSVEQPLDGLGDLVGGGLGRFLGETALVAEWFAGSHKFGDFVPGLNWHNDKGWVVIVGYKFSNTPGSRGDGAIIEIGKTF